MRDTEKDAPCPECGEPPSCFHKSNCEWRWRSPVECEHGVFRFCQSCARAAENDTPRGMTISEDGRLLSWRGENYVRQDLPDEMGDEVPVSRWALRALIRWVTLFAFLFVALVGFVLAEAVR